MTKTEMKKLQAQLAAAKKAKANEIKEIVESIQITKEIAKLDSPLYNKRELQRQDNMRLDALVETISEQYAADDRKMSLVFGYGIIPSKILAIMKSIQFSKHDEKEDLLLMTGLDEQIIEDTLTAFGNTAYFSKANIEVVPEQPMDIDRVKELLETVAIDMQLVSELDLSAFNQTNVDYQYKRAALRAEEMYNNTKEYVETATDYEE
jgi:hypothetical protein